LAVVVNLLAIPIEATPLPAQATEEMPVTEAESTMNMKMDNVTNCFEDWTLKMSHVNTAGYGGYQTTRAYPIQADHPSPHTPMGPNY
jgi:hypothetical protein